MSAEMLRRAAALMRERAEGATPGPWHSLGQWLAHDVNQCTCYGGSLPEGHEGGCGIEQIGTLTAPDAKHAASWHPAVALAVADWLEEVAERQKPIDPWGRRSHGWTGARAANAVARAYLGEPS